jgi:hypothetical protein
MNGMSTNEPLEETLQTPGNYIFDFQYSEIKQLLDGDTIRPIPLCKG